MNLSALFENATLKLFSLVTALVLFFFVSVENSTPVDVDFRVEYRTAEDTLVTNNPPSLLHITLEGPWAALRSFDSSHLEPVIIDLTRAGLGTMRHAVALREIRPPGGMRVHEVRPSELEIVLDRRTERLVPIHADIPDGPAFGYEVRSTHVTPERARVLGPATRLQSLEYLATEPIDIIGRESGTSFEVEVRAPPSPLRLIDRHATVYVEIGEETVQRTFPAVSVKVIGAPPQSRFAPREVSLTLRGPRRLVEALEAENLGASVDLRGEALGNQLRLEKTVTLSSPLPQRTQLIGQPPRVTILIGGSTSGKGAKK